MPSIWGWSIEVKRTVDVILVGKDIAIVFWYKTRCTEFLRKKMEFQILESEFIIDDFSTAEF